MPVLSAQQLRKQYPAVTALDGVSLEVEAGQVFGLLGPNGSGKTTLLGILLGVIHADGGSFSWFPGGATDHPRRRIGALLETPNFYPYLDAVRNLEIVALARGVERPPIPALLEQVGLAGREGAAFQTYSLGMKQRLALAACLVGDPEVLVLDEPTNGLDPQGMIDMRGIIRGIAARGKTILIASHLLDEVEKVCTHAAILRQGRLLAAGPVGALLGGRPQVELACAAEQMEALRSVLLRSHPGVALRREGEHWAFDLPEGADAAGLNRLAHESGVVLTHLVVKARSLELEFLEITRS